MTASSERAEGNPFDLEEILHMLIRAGAQLAIPDSVHGVIAARLDLLELHLVRRFAGVP